jgi:hypothetical protein
MKSHDEDSRRPVKTVENQTSALTHYVALTSEFSQVNAGQSLARPNLTADMDGYQFLSASHSIRAYLEVLYRL